MAKAYIAGPMRHYPEFNFPAFFAAEERLVAQGVEVLSPARMDIEVDGLSYKGKTGEEAAGSGVGEIDSYINRDVAAIMSLDPAAGDFVYLLKGWEGSKGASAEAALARWRGLSIVSEEPPKSMAGDPRFHALLKQIADLHERKQQDYGSDHDPYANVRASIEWGVKPWIGALLRLNDKVHRLQRFAQKGVLANESAEDSMMDVAVYALIAYILYREESGK